MQGLGRLPLHLGDVDAFFGHLVKGRKLAQLGDDLHHLIDDVVDLLLRVKAAQAEADRGMGQVFANSQSLQHIAGLQGGRSTRRTARDRNVVDAHQERLAFDISKAHVEVVRQAMLQRAVDENLIKLGFEALFKAITQPAESNSLVLHFLLAEFTGFAEADDARHIERAGTHTAFVAAAINDGRELHAWVATANVQRANTFWAVNLVAADGQHVNVVFLHVDRNFAYRLYAVRGEENPVFLGDFADFRDWIDHSNLIVGIHDGNQNGGWADSGFQLIQVDPAIFLHRQIGDFKTVFFQALAGIQHGLVLDSLSDDVIALFAEHFRDAFDHQVVGFGGAAGKDDFFRRGVD